MSALTDLATPALLLDEDRLKRNVAAMVGLANRHGCVLRPHLKTAKSTEILALLVEAGVDRFAVSTLAEAEYLWRACPGADYFLAVPLVAAKVERFAALRANGCRISGLIDSVQAIALCGEAALDVGTTLPLWVEIDVDGYRNGCDMTGDAFERVITSVVDHPAISLMGLMSYAGAAYTLDSSSEIATLAEQHNQALHVAQARAVPICGNRPVTSFGGSPASCHARPLSGIDELRCGIRLFGDMFQRGLGVVDIDDIAITVLTRVIATYPTRGSVFVDAGAFALSSDRSTAGRSFDVGYGRVADIDGCPIDDLVIGSVGQEIGAIVSQSGCRIDTAQFPYGRLLRILPNHADPTAAAYPGYNIVGEDGRADRYWPRGNYW